MERRESKFGIASTVIGMVNPAALVLLIRSPVAGWLLIGVPIVGISLGVVGILGTQKKAFAIVGVILNLLPLGFALLLAILFSGGSGGWRING